MLQMTLTPVREDRARYAVLVSYEPGPMADYGAAMVAIRREWQWVQDPNGKWRWQVVRVSQLRRVPGLRGREWPRKIDRPYERPEEMRRLAIREMRRLVHVDPAKGNAEPDWDRALQLRDEALARVAAGEKHLNPAPALSADSAS